MRKSISNLWAEFRAFAFKGNMIDLAVAVVIGAAFGGVINSLVGDIIMPSISHVTQWVKEAKDATATAAQRAASVTGLAASQPSTQPTTNPGTQPAEPAVAAAAPPPAPPAPAPAAAPAAPTKQADDKPVDFNWRIGRVEIGKFIASLLNFTIVAFAVFIVIVKLLGSVMKRVGGGTPKPGEPTTKECPECLSIIPIKARRCSSCTAVLVPLTATESSTTAPTTPTA